MRTLCRTAYVALVAATFVLVTFPGRPASAFHSGGVGDCGGCHIMHQSTGGGAADNNSSSYPYLMKSSDPGSTCLNCHQKGGAAVPAASLVATPDADMPEGIPPRQLAPGGDFGWLKKSYRWEAAGDDEGGQSPGERHGHNIVAADYGFVADSTLTVAPGGAYPANKLSCISCHDPHGRYRRDGSGAVSTTGKPIVASGSYADSVDPGADFSVGVYRLLGGVGYSPRSVGTDSFAADPPAAVCPSDYNRPEERSDTRVAYGKGSSEWCANCHAAFLAKGSAAERHPAGDTVKLSAEVAANYNAYVASGKLSGNRAAAYTSLVPFEMGTADYSRLKTTANSDGSMTSGPDPGANVMCLTCHRAHATGWDKATRWNMRAELLVWNGEYPGKDRGGVPLKYSQGRTLVEIRKTFYDRPAGAFAAYQRSLCNKCHAKD